MYVVRKGYEFNESNLYNEVGHWGTDGQWHALDHGSREEMEKKAHYLNGGFVKEIEDQRKHFSDEIFDLKSRVNYLEQFLKKQMNYQA